METVKKVKTFEISLKNVSDRANGKRFFPPKKGSKLKFTDEHAHYVLDLAFLNSRMSSKMFTQKNQERKMRLKKVQTHFSFLVDDCLHAELLRKYS